MLLTPSHMVQRLTRQSVGRLRLVAGSADAVRDLTDPLGAAVEGLWSRHDQRAEAGVFQKGPACLVGFAPDDTVMLRGMMRQLGLGPCAACLNTDQLQEMASLRDGFLYLVVNVDAFEDATAAVDAMLSFRQVRRDVVVILVSAAVAMDDLGAERRMICDATLRLPVTLGRLKLGVAAAFENHFEGRRS